MPDVLYDVEAYDEDNDTLELDIETVHTALEVPYITVKLVVLLGMITKPLDQ